MTETTTSSRTTTSDSAIVKSASGGEKISFCSLRCGGVAVVAVLALALTVLAANASAASLGPFSGIASGVSGGFRVCHHADTSFCPDSDTCTCVPFTGTGKASVIGSFTLSTTVVFFGTDVGDCAEAVGAATLTAKNGKDKLVLDYTGFVCSVGAPSNSDALNANYVVDGASSAGKFAGASGSGNIAGAENLSNGDMTGNANVTLMP